MPSFTATNTTLAGLGLSFDTLSVSSSFSSSEESFDSLFSDETRVSSASDETRVSATGDQQPGHWNLFHASASDWDPEPEDDFNYFEPYQGVPEVEDFVPWPTSPDAVALAGIAQTYPEPESLSVPPTPNDHGYETDTDSPRVQRRQRRRNAHKLHRHRRVHYLVEHVQPTIEDLPSLEECQRRVAEDASPEPAEEDVTFTATTAIANATCGLGLGLPTIDEDAHVDVEEGFDADAEQDITDCQPPSDPEFESGFEFIPEHNAMYPPTDSDADADDASYDSDDSDVDHYLYDSDGNLDMDDVEEEGARPVCHPRGPVHYTVRHIRPIVEDLPSLEELRARMGITATTTTPTSDDQPAATVGLGISLDLLPLPFLDEPAASRRSSFDDGEFETIDLTDDAPVPEPVHVAPSAPALRPLPAAESPSPIVLASPVPLAAFRRFDDVLFPGHGAETEYARATPFA
ncbi:hypothetical protein C8Q77DRAFT_1071929 [Trametes polyzona]|nr:hypothetical protein C8Q77DRAFT_1071929 [Trametes polyzona]